MKTKFVPVFSFKLLRVLTLCTTAFAANAQERLSPTHTILVTGEGEASAPPDRAIVRLGAMAQTPQADSAQNKVNETMQKALDAIEKVGVPRRSIHTSGLTLNPVYASEKLSSAAAEGPKVI